MQKDTSSHEVVLVNMLDFSKTLHVDISDQLDDWLYWNVAYNLTKEDLQSRLDRLQKLIQAK